MPSPNLNIVSTTPEAEGTVVVTEAAAAAIANYLEENGAPPDAGLRIGVRGGGCSGLSYFLDVETTPRENDHVIEAYGSTVYVDPKSLIFLQGTVLDYVTGLMESGFKFLNPKVTKSCGCGESFTM